MKPDLNHPRCQRCPMLSPECQDRPCVMYGLEPSPGEIANPQRMYATLQRMQKQKLDQLREKINGDRNL